LFCNFAFFKRSRRRVSEGEEKEKEEKRSDGKRKRRVKDVFVALEDWRFFRSRGPKQHEQRLITFISFNSHLVLSPFCC
jgi:hypothetical protein